jgi:hypothetical protein
MKKRLSDMTLEELGDYFSREEIEDPVIDIVNLWEDYQYQKLLAQYFDYRLSGYLGNTSAQKIANIVEQDLKIFDKELLDREAAEKQLNIVQQIREETKKFQTTVTYLEGLLL